MENHQQKWVTGSFVALSALLAFLIFSFGQKFAGAYDLEARLRNIEMILRGVSLVIGTGLFVFLYKSEPVNQFMSEVVVELSRVSWPTQKETQVATVMVVIMVLISGLFLGFLDYLWTELLKWII